jgi:hypothetical protein
LYPLLRPGSGEDLLGQGRSVVGEVGLFTDHGEVPVEAGAPQGLDDGQAGGAGADDRDPSGSCHE